MSEGFKPVIYPIIWNGASHVLNDYEQEAIDFLAKTSASIGLRFLDCRPYFDDGEDARNVWEFQITTERGSYVGTFGDSIQATKANEEPSAYDILSCLEKYEPDTFESFCKEFGYDEKPLSEYPKVKRIYDACVKEFAGLLEVFSEEELDLLREVQ